MKRLLVFLMLAVITISLVASACAQPAPAPASPAPAAPAPAKPAVTPVALPRSIEISCYPQGTIGHIVASGLAKIVTSHTSIAASSKPMEGATVQLPMVNRGEIEIGMCVFPDIGRAWTGTGEFNTKHSNLRHLTYAYFVVPANLVVRRDSNLTKLTDLKGKRVTSGFAGDRMINYQLDATLASAGMKWSDVVAVPVANMPASLKALQEGRVDAAFAMAPNVPLTMELDAAIPLRILPCEAGPQFEKAIEEFLPGCKPTMIKAGMGIAKEDALSHDLPFTFYSSTNFSEEAVYQVVKALFENTKEMQPVHAVMGQFSGPVMVSKLPPAPFHPGAIRLYKEKGVWTPEMDAHQKKYLQ